MSKQSFIDSRLLEAEAWSTHALVMALARRTWKNDPETFSRVQAAFPEICAELRQRYYSPGGVLPGDTSSKIPNRLRSGI